MTDTEPTVFLVDDDHAVRDALELLLESAAFKTASFENATAFLNTYTQNQAGCLVLDIRMPDMSGMELQDVLTAKGITLPIIFLTGHGNVPMSARAFRTGAVDFMEKPFDESALLERIGEAIQLDRINRETVAKREHARARLTTLTPREQQVMLLVVTGKVNKEIAAELNLSHRTVEIHRSRVMEKTGTQSLTRLIELAIASGLYQLD
ncbi:MAG TPA: DNA-binding response regulator [Gammaproteobacteria bacterium]|nr:DNA-binding response regulator [Gammaproteobacteria bacterium]